MATQEDLDYLYECIFGERTPENERKRCIIMDAFDEILKDIMVPPEMLEILEKITITDCNGTKTYNEELADEAEIAKLKEFRANLELCDDDAESMREQFFGKNGYFKGLNP